MSYSEEGKIEKKGEVKNGRLNGKVKITENDLEFEGEYLNDWRWNGKIKETYPKLLVKDEYKNHKFSGKVKKKNKNGEFYENIYLNGKLWTGTKVEEYDYYCSPDYDKGCLIGEYLNGRKWKGKGKEFYPDKKIFSKENMIK